MKNQELNKTKVFILYKIGENFVVILHIYGDGTVFLIFYDHQETGSE